MKPDPRRRGPARTGPATEAPPASSADDPRIAAALVEYFEDLQDGRCPSRAGLLARHPEIADDLAECLDGLEFLQSAAANLAPSAPEAPAEEGFAPSTVLGDYRIIREVGRGGMGVVYEAEQVSLGRLVALKVLPFALAIDPKQRQRFRVEAQAAAHLHHPHIVPIFAVGQDTGVPYYAMQFIDGKTLAAAIAEIRRFGGPGKGRTLIASDPASPPPPGEDDVPPTISLDGSDPASRPAPKSSGGPASHLGRAHYRAVARLGIQAAEALEHAHGLGVVHRDIKPANLLIDGDGTLWVTDFGLARFRDDPGPTRTGDLLGTLRYMSPEQIQARRGVVDQRADVYALGATLFEALTLRPAFGGRDRQELLQRILADEPTPPRKIDPAIPRDLETIVLKAMAKEPSGRYATAQELADDLERFLEDRAILACRPSPMDRASRWVRRHYASVATAASVLVVAAVVGSLLVWTEQQKAWKFLARADQGIDVALKASSTITVYAMEKMTEYANGRFGDEDRRFFERALGFYGQVELLLRDDPSPKRRETLAKTYFGLGLTRWLLDRDGTEDHRRSVAVYEELIAADPARDDLRTELARTLQSLAGEQAARGLYTEADATYRKLIALQTEVLVRSPEVVARRASLAASRASWAFIRAEIAGREEAETILEEAIAAHPVSGIAQNNLAWLLVGDPSRAPYDPERAVAHARLAVASEPKAWQFWHTLGLALFRAGVTGEAREAINTSMSLHGAGGAGTADDWFVLAMIDARSGRSEAARDHFRRGQAWMDARGRSGDPELGRIRDQAKALCQGPERAKGPPVPPPARGGRRAAIAPPRPAPPRPPDGAVRATPESTL